MINQRRYEDADEVVRDCWTCGECGEQVSPIDIYCPFCGAMFDSVVKSDWRRKWTSST